MDSDLLTGGVLTPANEIAVVPGGPLPGLFCAQPSAPAPARRLLQAPSGHLQLDSTIEPEAYAHFIPGPRTSAHFAHLDARAADLASRLAPSARVLEIGAGDCALLLALHRLRPDLYLHAIDPGGRSPADAIQLSRRPLAAHQYRAGSFDLIISEHCLEHSPHPLDDLRHMAALLSDNGELELEVPDIEATAGAPRPINLSVIYALHASYFTARSLRFLAARAGLAAIDLHPVDHYGSSLFASFLRSHDPAVRALPANPPPGISRHFAELAAFGSMLPAGLPCWGASERCISNLAGIMAGGFKPHRLIDSNPAVQGKFPVGLNIAVTAPADLAAPLSEVLILSPLSARTILRECAAYFAPQAVVYLPFFGRFQLPGPLPPDI